MKSLYHWDLCKTEFRKLWGVGCSQIQLYQCYFQSFITVKGFKSLTVMFQVRNVVDCSATMPFGLPLRLPPLHNHCCRRHRQQHPLLLRDGSRARCRCPQAVVVCRYILKAHAPQDQILTFLPEKCLEVICLDTDQCPSTNVSRDSFRYGRKSAWV